MVSLHKPWPRRWHASNMASGLNQPAAPRISFNELVSGSEGVRYTDVDAVPYMSVRDIIMVVCGQNNKRASETWQRLPEEYKNEVSAFCRNHN